MMCKYTKLGLDSIQDKYTQDTSTLPAEQTYYIPYTSPTPPHSTPVILPAAIPSLQAHASLVATPPRLWQYYEHITPNGHVVGLLRTSTHVTHSTATELYVLNSNLPDLQHLLTLLSQQGKDVLVLNMQHDGLTQISQHLTTHTIPYQAIHVLSHGNEAMLELGSTQLTTTNVAQHASQLALLGDALTADADILLYGCNIAQGTQGASFIQQLAMYTGADIAASTNLTGKDGDWVLEYTAGDVSSPTLAISSYLHSLDITVEDTSANDVLTGSSGDDWIWSRAGNDTIHALAGNDQILIISDADMVINAGDGDDTIVFDSSTNLGASTVTAGRGSDLIEMYGGNKVFVFNLGDGQDIIKAADYYVANRAGIIQFGIGITASNISMEWTGPRQVTISINNTTDRIQVNESAGAPHEVISPAQYSYPITTLQFADGSSMSVQQYFAAQLQGVTVIAGTSGDDSLQGTAGNDYIWGISGSDTIYGNAGDDVLVLPVNGRGDVYAIGGSQNDIFVVQNYIAGAKAFISAGLGSDTIVLDTSISDTVILQEGDSLIDIKYKNPSMGNALFGYWVSASDFVLIEQNQGNKITMPVTVQTDGSMRGALGNITFADGTQYDYTPLLGKHLTGTVANDSLQGSAAADYMAASAGNDVLTLMAGHDLVYGEDGNDYLDMGDGDDRAYGGNGNDTLIGGAGADRLEGNKGNNTFDGGAGNDRIYSAALIDDQQHYWFGRGSEIDLASSNSYFNDILHIKAGVVPTDIEVSYVGAVNTTDLYIAIKDTADLFVIDVTRLKQIVFDDGTVWDMRQKLAVQEGTNNADTLLGTATNDILIGGAGNDTINGGTGTDLMIGGAGDDVYIIDNINDHAVSYANDTLFVSVDNYFAGDFNPNNVVYAPSTLMLPYFIKALLHGSSIGGNIGINTTIYYCFRDPSSIETQYRPEGGFNAWTTETKTTAVNALQQWAITSGITFIETNNPAQSNLNFYNDSFTGGSAVTRYPVVNVYDHVAAEIHLQNNIDDRVMMHEIGHALGLKHTFDTPNPLVSSEDFARNSVMSYVGTQDIESLGMFDLAAVHYLYGVNPQQRAGDDVYTLAEHYVWDGAGSDTLSAADQTTGVYIGLRAGSWNYIGSINESILATGQSYLGVGTSIEHAIGGAGNDTLEGSTLDNRLLGGAGADSIAGLAGNDTLDGGEGNDTMAGGMGDDTYVIDSANDVVTELLGEGIDTITTSVTLTTLAANVENVTITATTSVNAVGNELANVIDGGSGANSLSGGAGNDTLSGNDGVDTLVGGMGNDVYWINGSVADVIVENANEGYDTVLFSCVGSNITTFTLPDNVEACMDAGFSLTSIIGNSLDNDLDGRGDSTLYGMIGNDRLGSGDGIDTLVGGVGDDVYNYISNSDSVIEDANEGIDTVLAITDYTLPANVENLQLIGGNAANGTGNAVNNGITGRETNNILSGLAGNDTLDGAAGADTLVGGLGNDTYYVDNAGDVVTELTSQGTDRINSSVSYTLPTNVEYLQLTGSSAINGTGNAANNIIYANAGNNIIDGMAGVDGVSYAYATTAVTVSLATTTAQATGGSASDTLINIENLYGSKYNDALIGNAVANVLNGGAGADTLVGGLGNDTYYVDNAGDVVTELTSQGADRVNSSISYTLPTNVEYLQLTGSSAINGTGNASKNIIYANAGNNIIDGMAGVDGVSYAYATTAVTVSLATTTAQTTGGSGSDTLKNIENLYGSKYNDALTGNTSANYINAGDGNDTLNGGAGADTLIGGAGADIFVFNTDLNVSTNKDTISDFNVTDDTIYLENLIFSKLTTNGILNTAYFNAGAGITTGQDANDYIVYNTADGNLYYDADGSGTGTSICFATCTGAPILTSADFVVI